jgi:uncharacterized membrane protein
MAHSIEAKLQKNRRFTEKLADEINRVSGSFFFFVLNIALFAGWIFINSGRISNLPVFDPYPFTFLTMVVSLEAIVLSIFVLISQNRQSTIDTLREEIHLQINEVAEREITKCLQLLTDLHRKEFPNSPPDPELERMLSPVNPQKIQSSLQKELEPPPLVLSELIEKIEEKLASYRRKK